MIGYGLPYVFVEKVKLTHGTIRTGDRNYFEDNNPSFKKNKFGRNVNQKKDGLSNKDYYTDEAVSVNLNLSIPELYFNRTWFGKKATKKEDSAKLAI